MGAVATQPDLPPDILALHAAGQPAKIALIGESREVSFQELNQRANRVAHAVLALGAQPGDRAAVMAYNSVAGFEVSSGLRKAGLIGVPVNFRLRGPEVAYILNDSAARVTVAGPDFVSVVEAARSTGRRPAGIATRSCWRRLPRRSPQAPVAAPWARP
jgi:fatty-acyl-CoA synthase